VGWFRVEFRGITSLRVLRATGETHQARHSKHQRQNWLYYIRENFDFKYYLSMPLRAAFKNVVRPTLWRGIPNILNRMAFCPRPCPEIA